MIRCQSIAPIEPKWATLREMVGHSEITREKNRTIIRILNSLLISVTEANIVLWVWEEILEDLKSIIPTVILPNQENYIQEWWMTLKKIHWLKILLEIWRMPKNPFRKDKLKSSIDATQNMVLKLLRHWE